MKKIISFCVSVLIVISFVILIACFFNRDLNYIINTKIEDIAYKYNIYNIVFKLKENKEERTINDKVFNDYLNTFSKVKEKLIYNYVGNKSRVDIKGVHGWYYYHWIRAYEIRAPFMEKPFEVWVDNRTHKIFGNNFYETIVVDPKFQHLYSNWVKKQVGIEDENVEFGFAGNFDDPYIDFDKITTLSEDYREVFENTHNLYCNKCYINNLFELNEENAKVIADELRNKYLFNASKITGMPQEKKISGHIYMSTNAFNSGAGSDFAFKFDLHNFSSELNIF